MSDDRSNNRYQNTQQQQPPPPQWNSPRSSSTVTAASALLGSMNAAAATTAAAVLQSAEVQSIFEDVYGSRTTAAVGDVSRRNSSNNSSTTGTAAATAAAASLSAAQIQDIAWMRQKQQEFNMAVRLLPDTDKAAYQEALTRSPHLVAVESPPKRYLQIERDPMDAARRLCAYWRQRKACFGTRAFLPMVQTGTGALSPEDVEMLGSGFVMLLPPDRYGRTVLLHDRVRLSGLNADQRLRCIFYLLQVASETSGAQLQPASKGLVWMTVYSDKTRASAFDAHTSTRALKLCASGAFPLQFKAFHLIMMTNRPILDRVVPTTLELLQEHFPHLRQRTMVHPKLALPVMLKSLEVNHGFDAENLPKVPLGGRWTIGSFKRWRDDRLHREQKWLEKIKNKQEAQAALLPHSAMPSQLQTREQPPQEQRLYQQQKHDERIQREEQILPHRQTQQSLQAESLATAGSYFHEEDSEMDEKIASSALTEQEDEDRRKRRAADAMYARRRRVRRQIEIEGMQEQVHRLRRQKMGLQQTKEMLLGLLHQAQECVRREEENTEFVSGADKSPGEFSGIETSQAAKRDASRVTRPEKHWSGGERFEENKTHDSAGHGHFKSPSGAEVSMGTTSAADSAKESDKGSMYSKGKGPKTSMSPTNVSVGSSWSGKADARQSGAKNLADACKKPSGRRDELDVVQNTQPGRHALTATLAADLNQQSEEERQQRLVQSWHEQYARYQMQVFKYIQEQREQQQAEAAAALATAVLQGAVEQQSPRQTTSLLGIDLNEHLLQQARLAWMRQQQQGQEGQPQEFVTHDDDNSDVPSQRKIELPERGSPSLNYGNDESSRKLG